MEVGLVFFSGRRVFWPMAQAAPAAAGGDGRSVDNRMLSESRGGSVVSEKSKWESLRPWPVYAMAATIPFSLTATNLFKFFLFMFGLIVLGLAVARREPLPQLAQLRTPAVVLLMLGALALSFTYTAAPADEA